jgi:ubiquinol-cytochrome c reductase cytochrome b subunit
MGKEHQVRESDREQVGFWSAVDERLGLSGLAYPVPEHANSLPYMLGGITLFGFVVLIATGVLMAQFYDPNPATAHQSVIYLITQVPFGDFLRSVHFWTANLVMVTVILHVSRVFATASYKRPREANWLIGLGLLAVTLGFIFTGTVLKWDQEAVEALAHNIEIAELLGLWGTWFSGEFSLSVPLLTRLYIGHITLLPAIFTVLIIAHLYLIKMHGISEEATEDATAGPPTSGGTGRFTTHLVRMTGYGLLLFVVTGVLALLRPAPLGMEGVPGAEVTKPPWMFLPFYPLEDVAGIQGLFWGAVVLFGLLALVPFVDRSTWRSPRRRRWVVGAGAVLLVVLIALGLFAWVNQPAEHLMG